MQTSGSQMKSSGAGMFGGAAHHQQSNHQSESQLTQQKSSMTKVVTNKGRKDGKGMGFFGEFIIGIILICFSLPTIWMNERK